MAWSCEVVKLGMYVHSNFRIKLKSWMRVFLNRSDPDFSLAGIRITQYAETLIYLSRTPNNLNVTHMQFL